VFWLGVAVGLLSAYTLPLLLRLLGLLISSHNEEEDDWFV